MADAQRLTVDNLVLHHAVTGLWENWSKAQLAQWFSDNGFARAYGSSPSNWSGLINPYTGARSYSQAQLAGQRVTNATPDATDAERRAGYRLVPLVKDIWGQICWHAGNWTVNRRSIGIENLGDYRNYTLRDGDCKVIADFWRGHDQALKGITMVYGHREVSTLGTECPARIMEKRDHIINLINSSEEEKKDMVTSAGVDRIFRFRLGREADQGALKTYTGKHTDDELDKIVKASSEYKNLVKRYEAGERFAKNHLPSGIRDQYIEGAVAIWDVDRIFRFRLGRQATDAENAKFVGKMTNQEVDNEVRATKEYKDLPKLLKDGKFVAKNHLPSIVRDDYQEPTGTLNKDNVVKYISEKLN